MSSIFAYAGSKPCKDILLKGLCALEKRGSGAAGIALKISNDILSVKTRGGAKALKSKTQDFSAQAFEGIGSGCTSQRCALTDFNAKPASNNLFAVCADGHIDNFDSLKHRCVNPFPIDTDDDLLLALLCICFQPKKLDIIKKITPMIEGNPTYAFMPNDERAIYCKKGDAPLVIAVGSGGSFVSSEVNAVIHFADKYFFLEDGECARVSADRITVYDKKYKKVKKQFLPVPESGYFESDYPVSDEIFYCPSVVKQTISAFEKEGRIDFDYLKFSRRNVDKIEQIVLAGTGSSYNASRVCKYNFNSFTDIPCFAYESSQLNNNFEQMDKNTLFIAVSHRGESTDTVECAKKAKKSGARTIALTSNPCSYLAYICSDVINPRCDFESGEISCRSFLSQYIALTMLALYLGRKQSIVTELYLSVAMKMAQMLFGKISSSVKSSPKAEKTARDILEADYVFCTGLGIDCALAEEAALKLRRIAGINASSYGVGELLMSATPLLSKSIVIAFITNPDAMEKALRRLREIKSTGARVFIITCADSEDGPADFDNVISWADSVPVFNPLPCISGLYKIAITAAEIKNRGSIDKAV